MLITEAAERLWHDTTGRGWSQTQRQQPRLWKGPSLQGAGPPSPSAEGADCSPGLVPAPRSPAAAEGDLGRSQGWSQQTGPWRVRRTSENQLVIESQQVEEPGWARPEQVAWGTPLDHRGAGDAGQKLHFRREGRGSKRKMEGD